MQCLHCPPRLCPQLLQPNNHCESERMRDSKRRESRNNGTVILSPIQDRLADESVYLQPHHVGTTPLLLDRRLSAHRRALNTTSPRLFQLQVSQAASAPSSSFTQQAHIYNVLETCWKCVGIWSSSILRYRKDDRPAMDCASYVRSTQHFNEVLHWPSSVTLY